MMLLVALVLPLLLVVVLVVARGCRSYGRWWTVAVVVAVAV
jgi:hypothetical protein